MNGDDSPLSDSQTLHFENDHPLGRLMLRGDHEDDAPWESIGDARGVVAVPSGSKLALVISPSPNDELVNLAALAALQPHDLHTLSFVLCEVDDTGLAYIKHLTGLHALDFTDCVVSNAGVKHLQALTSLQSLHFVRSTIVDQGLSFVQGLGSLQELTLAGTMITDAGLVYLQGLKVLRHLDLSDTVVTDTGLVQLKGLTSLQSLHLDGTAITDVGLVHLRSLTTLRTLYLLSTRVSAEGVRSLQQALPQCTIFDSSDESSLDASVTEKDVGTLIRDVDGELYDEILATLFRYDPLGLDSEGNLDEYSPEADTIIPRLPEARSVEDVRRIVHEEFEHWFGAGNAGPETRYDAIASDVWDAWQQHKTM